MQSRGDQGQAEHKQPRADEDKECPGLHHSGQNKKERPRGNNHNQSKQRQRDWTPRTGLSGASLAARTPPPGLEHPGTSGGGRPPDWNIRGGTSSRRDPQKRPRGQGRGDAVKQS